MSQLSGLPGANQQTQINNGNDITMQNKDGLNASNVNIDESLKIKIEEHTGLGEAEKLKAGGRTDPKPESTRHKVGRFLMKALGALLVVGGVAAAIVATVASCGIGPAVVAGTAAMIAGAVGGVTGASVIAGAAGAAGIGLIAGSAKMKPKEPKALLQKENIIENKPAGNAGAKHTAKELKFGENQVNDVVKDLKKNGFDTQGLNVADSAITLMVDIGQDLEKNDGAYRVKSDTSSTFYKEFVEEALRGYKVNTFEVSKTNVLLTRLAINQCFSDTRGYDKEIGSLNNKETVKSISDFLNREIETSKSKGDVQDAAKLRIFLGALTNEYQEDVPAPKAAPLNLIGTNLINLIDDDVPIVPINKKEPQDITNGKPVKIVSISSQKPKSTAQDPVKTVSMSAQTPSGQPTNQVMLGEGEISTIETKIKGLDKNFKFNEPEGGTVELMTLCQSGYKGVGGNIHLENADALYRYLGNLMKANGVTSYKLTSKNVLLVRLGISHFLKDMGHYSTYFNGKEMQKNLREYFKDQMDANRPGKRWANPETYQMSAILLSVFTPNDWKGNVVLTA